MSAWIKGATTALIVMVTAGILSVLCPAASADTGAGTPAAYTGTGTVSSDDMVRAMGATTFAERVAARAFRKVKAKFDRERRTAARVKTRTGRRPIVKPMTHLSRWRGLPDAVRVPMQGLYAADGRHDTDRRVAFFTGSNDTAACLAMRSGHVRRGVCGIAYRPMPGALTQTYDALVRSAQWFDARTAVYGQSARSTSLIASLVRASPVGTTAEIVDGDDDGIIDSGTITLVFGDTCGTVVLPEPGPSARAYRAELLHGLC